MLVVKSLHLQRSPGLLNLLCPRGDPSCNFYDVLHLLKFPCSTQLLKVQEPCAPFHAAPFAPTHPSLPRPLSCCYGDKSLLSFSGSIPSLHACQWSQLMHTSLWLLLFPHFLLKWPSETKDRALQLLTMMWPSSFHQVSIVRQTPAEISASARLLQMSVLSSMLIDTPPRKIVPDMWHLGRKGPTPCCWLALPFISFL